MQKKVLILKKKPYKDIERMSDETDNNKSQVNLESNGNVEINGNPIGITSTTTTNDGKVVDENVVVAGKKEWVKFDDDDSNKNKIQVRICVCMYVIINSRPDYGRNG